MATILLIEDDRVVRTALTSALHRRGHIVIATGSGTEGLQSHAAGSGAFDLVICDLLLPEGGGLETIRTLRARAPHLPVLVVSGAPHALRYVEEDGDSHARMYLMKPFEMPVFLEAVDRLLSQPAIERTV
jgi:CheY-like chemotaxis protein